MIIMINRIKLFLMIGLSMLYTPYLESRYGLREMFGILSKNKRQLRCDKDSIRRYVHVWIGIGGILKTQHCWNRTLLLYTFLKSARYNAVIYVGIRKDAIGKTSIVGHSWVAIDGRVFDDREDVADDHYITFHYP